MSDKMRACFAHNVELPIACSHVGDEWKLVKHEVICARCGIRQDGAGSKEVAF